MTQSPLARTETDLIGAVRSGDDRAFGELYARYGGSVLGYIAGILRDRGRAEDVTQDVFVSALKALRASDRAIAFKSWIYEIARNACIDEFRRAKRCPEVCTDSDAVTADELSAATPSPDIYLERRQQLDALRGAFRGLSECQHKVLVMRELEGRPYAEIARQTGMSVPMVESTLFRARRRLGEEYDEIASGRRCARVQALVDEGGKATLGALGLRERRRFARHVAHCQPCRRHARLAGIDESALQVPSVARRIAALFPVPLVSWRELFRGGRLARVARSLHRAGQVADPAAISGASQTALAVAVAAMVASGGMAGGAGAHAQRGADASLAASTQLQAAPGPLHVSRTRSFSQPSAGPASVYRPARVATSTAGHGNSTMRHQIPRTSLPKVTTPVQSTPGSNPQPLPIPALPGNPLRKTERKLVEPLLHKTTSLVKRTTHTLHKLLPPPLRRLIPPLPGRISLDGGGGGGATGEAVPVRYRPVGY